jgi:uncharacterized protein (DUF2384 family)
MPTLKETLKDHGDLHDQLLQLFKNNEQQAMAWLTNSKAPLCDIAPLALLGSSEGKEQVIDMIYRIKTGDLS